MGSRVAEDGDQLVLDRLEGQTASGDPVLPPRKHPRDLHDAVFRKLGRRALYRVVIDDGLQHKGVVAVEPVREPARLGPGVEPSRPLGQRRHMPVERATPRLERRVIDEPVTDIPVENLIEDAVGPRLGTSGNRCQAPDADDERQTQPGPAEQGGDDATRGVPRHGRAGRRLARDRRDVRSQKKHEGVGFSPASCLLTSVSCRTLS